MTTLDEFFCERRKKQDVMTNINVKKKERGPSLSSPAVADPTAQE